MIKLYLKYINQFRYILISIIFNGKGNSKKLYQLLMNIIDKKEKLK